jgi:hypothetical protein
MWPAPMSPMVWVIQSSTPGVAAYSSSGMACLGGTMDI